MQNGSLPAPALVFAPRRGARRVSRALAAIVVALANKCCRLPLAYVAVRFCSSRWAHCTLLADYEVLCGGEARRLRA
eukprot:scaffold11474_cov114-Isochrysis_galbana.AAC.4